MLDEIVYMLCIVAVGFAVNYSLRALPFVIFAGSDRPLPKWVERLGKVISPVIIGGLIIYSYSTLSVGPSKDAAWMTPWPYVAGVLTVGLQLWKRNPLVSIIAGTVLYMFLISGCVTVRDVEYGPDHPILQYDSYGLKFDGERVKPSEVPDLLEDYAIPHDATIHIAVSADAQYNLKPIRMFMGYLAKMGYTRSVLVTDRHGDSELVKRPPQGASVRGGSAASSKPQIRYKGANE